jgi:hypothetical protein
MNQSHRDTAAPEYAAWARIVQRCTNPKNKAWEFYGGRGIEICAAWRLNYTAFLDYIGRRPSPKHSIDRYPNNDGNYEPGNVRWATIDQQARNKRTNLNVTFNGETMCIADWANKLSINKSVLGYRLKHGTFPFGPPRTPPGYCRSGRSL